MSRPRLRLAVLSVVLFDGAPDVPPPSVAEFPDKPGVAAPDVLFDGAPVVML